MVKRDILSGEIALPDMPPAVLDEALALGEHLVNFSRMFGEVRMEAAVGSADGSVRFFGLTPESMQLEDLDRHQRLLDSYRKLHAARARHTGVVV